MSKGKRRGVWGILFDARWTVRTFVYQFRGVWIGNERSVKRCENASCPVTNLTDLATKDMHRRSTTSPIHTMVSQDVRVNSAGSSLFSAIRPGCNEAKSENLQLVPNLASRAVHRAFLRSTNALDCYRICCTCRSGTLGGVLGMSRHELDVPAQVFMCGKTSV
jgi:hypothetical protein